MKVCAAGTTGCGRLRKTRGGWVARRKKQKLDVAIPQKSPTGVLGRASHHIVEEGQKRILRILSARWHLYRQMHKNKSLTLAFLKARYSSTPTTEKAKRTKLADDPFIGMWRTRKDMQDSTAWVRSQRQREWERGA